MLKKKRKSRNYSVKEIIVKKYGSFLREREKTELLTGVLKENLTENEIKDVKTFYIAKNLLVIEVKNTCCMQAVSVIKDKLTEAVNARLKNENIKSVKIKIET